MDERSSEDVQVRLRPSAWVGVAYDTDDDGQFDAFEYVYGYDLIRARSESSKRPQSEEMRRSSMQGFRSRGQTGMDAQQARRTSGSSRPAVFQVEGDVESLETVEVVGAKEPHVIATLRTDEGRDAKVELGSQADLADRGVYRGDRVQVFGTIGKVDDKPMLIADRVRHEGRTFRLEREKSPDLRRFEGEIQSTRTVQYKGMDEKHVQARVQLQGGRTTIVDLGPEKKASRASLERGKRIVFLADAVQIGGREALRAEQFRIENGQVIELDRDRERDRFQTVSGRPRLR